MKLKLIGEHKILACDDLNLLGDNIYTMKKNTGTIINDSKEVGLEIHIYIYIFMYISVLSSECR
jgi:hypothetical protein